jgi:hypothetical protein
MGYQAQRERKRKPQEPTRYKALGGFVEKRKLPRIEVRWPVTVITQNGSVKGEARNISAEGVYILFKHPVENVTLNETYLLLMDAAGQIPTSRQGWGFASWRSAKETENSWGKQFRSLPRSEGSAPLH